ncbi:MAG: CDP-diacylglycerol--glycerol-3-phosphate 3-phosphatidyltransferase [Alphaproteobacteria bacterium]|nr:CDP-diacylglycerol--glycerol-3-phosphate 3-phosphatidyltransferase [Alphaproteobacteria bacterium]
MRQLPNLLTGSRIAVIPLMVPVFYLPGDWGHWLSAGLFAYASITDFFDGYLARAWGVQSKLGRFLDPIADKLLVAAAILLLVHADRAHLIPSLAILAREILVSGLREYLAELRVSVPVSQLAKVKTGFQMSAIFLLLLGAGGPSWLYADILGQIALWLAAGLTLVTGYAYLRTGLRYMDD